MEKFAFGSDDRGASYPRFHLWLIRSYVLTLNFKTRSIILTFISSLNVSPFCFPGVASASLVPDIMQHAREQYGAEAREGLPEY